MLLTHQQIVIAFSEPLHDQHCLVCKGVKRGLWDNSESNFRGLLCENDYSRPPNEHQSSMAQSIGCTPPELAFVRREVDVGGAMTMYDDQIFPLVRRLIPVWKA